MSRWFFPMPIHAAVSPSRWTLDQGVDIAAPAHTPLLAIGDGVIVRHGISGFGNDAPVLKLSDGNYVYYGHAGPGNRLKDGTHVKAGQVIGEVGAGIVGISTGPHLEIGFSNASGNPVGRQTAKTMKQALGKFYAGGTKGITSGQHRGFFQSQIHGFNQGLKDIGVGSLLPEANPDPGPLGKAEDKVGSAAEKAARAGFSWGFNQLWDAVGAKAEYGGLFLVAMIAGAYLVVQGVKRAGRTPKAAPA